MILYRSLDGEGLKGRPMKSWTDYARDDSARLGLSLTIARRLQAREACRSAIVLLQLI